MELFTICNALKQSRAPNDDYLFYPKLAHDHRRAPLFCMIQLHRFKLSSIECSNRTRLSPTLRVAVCVFRFPSFSKLSPLPQQIKHNSVFCRFFLTGRSEASWADAEVVEREMKKMRFSLNFQSLYMLLYGNTFECIWVRIAMEMVCVWSDRFLTRYTWVVLLISSHAARLVVNTFVLLMSCKQLFFKAELTKT